MAIRKRIGVLVPTGNATLEPDFYRAAPKDVSVHAHRLWLTASTFNAEGVDRMNSEIEQGCKYLAQAKVKAIVYGCTTGSFYKGPGWDKEMLEKMSQWAGGIPGVGTSPSVVEALRSIGAKKVSVVTPYPSWVNQRLKIYLEASGVTVLNLEGEPACMAGGSDYISDQDPADIVKFGVQQCRPEADALFCSCTAWRAMEAAGELEQRLGKPVITSNQATVWKSFRVLGIAAGTRGHGQLLDKLAAVAV